MATTTPMKPFGEVQKTGSTSKKPMDSTFSDSARDAIGSAVETAKESAHHVAEKAEEMKNTIAEKAEHATSSVGGGMQSLAGTLRENMPRSGAIGAGTDKVAEALECGGKYLQEEGLKGIGEDLTGLIRRNPVQAMLLGVGLGFLLARSTRS